MRAGIGHRVRKTVRRSADGREIICFDGTPSFPERAAVDARPLPPVVGGSAEMRYDPPPVVGGSAEMRYDPLTGEWVSPAVHRNDRTFMPPADQAPLAPAEPSGFPTEIAESSYDVVA
jgi:beta-galactosidase